jgi:hypothetical protein
MRIPADRWRRRWGGVQASQLCLGLDLVGIQGQYLLQKHFSLLRLPGQPGQLEPDLDALGIGVHGGAQQHPGLAKLSLPDRKAARLEPGLSLLPGIVCLSKALQARLVA